MKRWLGLDLIDTAIHVFVTICVGILAVETGGSGPNEEIALAMVFGASAIVFGVRRHVALRRAERSPTTAEVEAERLADLEIRVAELEAAQARIVELEDRLDFSERLLAQQTRAAEPADERARGRVGGAL